MPGIDCFAHAQISWHSGNPVSSPWFGHIRYAYVTVSQLYSVSNGDFMQDLDSKLQGHGHEVTMLEHELWSLYTKRLWLPTGFGKSYLCPSCLMWACPSWQHNQCSLVPHGTNDRQTSKCDSESCDHVFMNSYKHYLCPEGFATSSAIIHVGLYISAWANSRYQMLSPPFPPRLGMRLPNLSSNHTPH